MSFEFSVLSSGLKRLRYLRWRLRPAEIATLLIVLTLCGTGLGSILNSALSTHNSALSQSRVERANAIYAAWNDMAASMHAENKLLDELQQNLKDNPPQLVFDPPNLKRRRDLYAAAIAEHQRQLKDLEQMRKEDR